MIYLLGGRFSQHLQWCRDNKVKIGDVRHELRGATFKEGDRIIAFSRIDKTLPQSLALASQGGISPVIEVLYE